MIGKLLFQIVKVERDVVHTVIATIRSGHCAPVWPALAKFHAFGNVLGI